MRGSPGSGESPPRLLAADLLRLGATIAVIALHVTATVVNQHGRMPVSQWWIAFFVLTGTRWAVPTFVMLSGLLLLDPCRQESASHFFAKRARRIGVPLLFWAVFYQGWMLLYREIPMGGSEIVNHILTGDTYYHTYYLFLVAGLYLITPPLRVFLRGATRQETRYAIALLFACSSAYALLRCWSMSARTISFGVPAFLIFLPYVGYYLAGSYLSPGRIPPRLLRYARAGLALGLAATASGTALTIARYGVNQRGLILYHYLAPNVILTVLCLWMLCHRAFPSGKEGKGVSDSRWFRECVDATFGVYLIHPAVLDLFASAGLQGLWVHPAVGIPVAVLATLAVSLILVACMRRLPGIRMLV